MIEWNIHRHRNRQDRICHSSSDCFYHPWPILAFSFQRHPGTPITELNSLASTAVPATKHPRPICFSQMCQRQHEGCTHQWTDPQNKLILVAKKGNARSEVWASVMKFFEPHEHENQLLWQRFLILNHYFTKGKKNLKRREVSSILQWQQVPNVLWEFMATLLPRFSFPCWIWCPNLSTLGSRSALWLFLCLCLFETQQETRAAKPPADCLV